MNTKRSFLFALLLSGLAISASGQINCPASTTAAREKLACVLPLTAADIGAAGTTVNGTTVAQLQQSLVNPFNASFATQLTQLPVPTGTVGTAMLKDKDHPYGFAFRNLGPILTDGAATIGKGRLYAGFSFQHFDFDRIDDFSLSNFNIGYNYQQYASSTDLQNIYRTFRDDISFQLDQYVALVTVGITQTTDVSVVIPFNSVNASATASDFKGYIYDSSTNEWITETATQTTQSNSGSASGVGDVSVSVKQIIHGSRSQGTHTAVAVGGSLRFPSGDALNYLGSGAYGGNAFGIFAYRPSKNRISPHLKLSYQWNGNSILVSTASNTKTKSLPGGAQYDGGADIRLRNNLTFAADLFGSQFGNTPSYSSVNIDLTSIAAKNPPPVTSLNTISVANNTYTTANLSTGFKWQIHGLLLIGNVTVPVNNAGLHSNPVPLFGAAYSFNWHK